MAEIFKNRTEAGILLAEKLEGLNGDALILGIPRGGLVIAQEIAKRINASLDIVVTRKIGHPFNPEFAIAAIDEDGTIERGREGEEIDSKYFKEESDRQKGEIKRRLKEYRGIGSHPDFRGKTCVVADDGIATGLTLVNAVNFLKKRGAKETIVAVPVLPDSLVGELRKKTDKLTYLLAPKIFFAVGQFYKDFPQVSDEEAINILKGKN